MAKLDNSYKSISDCAREVLLQESHAVRLLSEKLSSDFPAAVQAIHKAVQEDRGKVVVTGVGKSGLVGSKISATLSSTGTRAAFLHPTEAAHGDLGIICSEDVVLALSKSGETGELLAILPIVRKLGSSLVAMVGSVSSTLARRSDHVIDCSVEREACPHDLVPTTSTTATLAMGDALAIALLRLRDFSPDEFAVYHPSGALGRRLLLSVADLMHRGDRNPRVSADTDSTTVVEVMTESKLGGVNVVDVEGKLLGIITDGDVRRHIRRGGEFFSLTAQDMMTKDPQTICEDATAEQAYRKMEFRDSQISVLPVLDSEGRCVGILRLHDVIGGGRE